MVIIGVKCFSVPQSHKWATQGAAAETWRNN